MPEEPQKTIIEEESILGLSTTDLAGLSVDELLNNKTAITMIIHYYKKLVDDNNSLRNNNNTLQTYVDAYQRKKIYTNIAAWILAFSSVLIAFGVNLLTESNTWPGLATLIPGIIAIIVGLYFSNKE
jgi:hypothetical protein